jgi:hypothetical protein
MLNLSHDVYVDRAGNLYVADSGNHRVRMVAESFPPNTTINTGPAGTIKDSTPTFAFSSSEAGSDFRCRVDAGPYAACSSPHTTAPLADGSHVFRVRAIDPAGNTDPSPSSRSFTVDATPPQTTINSGPSGTTNDPTPTFAFSSEPGASFQCKLDSGPYAACSSPRTLGHLGDGSHTFRVRAKDAVGNLDPTAATRAFTVRTASVSISGTKLVVAAAPGAKDNLAITRPSASTLRVTDLPSGSYTGSGVHAFGGCTRSGDYTADCPAAGITLIDAASGDQADKVTNSTAVASVIHGGAGDDNLTGGSAGDTLVGQAGVDVFNGRGGNDLLAARDGASDGQIACGVGANDRANLDPLPADPDAVVTGCETKQR